MAVRLGKRRQGGNHVAEVAALAPGRGREDVVGIEVAHHRAVDEGSGVGGRLVGAADERRIGRPAAGERVLARLRDRLGVVSRESAGKAVGQVAPGSGDRVDRQLLVAAARGRI